MTDADAITREQARKATGQKEPSSKAGKYHRKSYLLTKEQIDLIKETADEEGLALNEFVRWAVMYVVNGVRDGSIEIPIVEEKKRRIAD